jgi:hypothetical protein
MVLPDEPHELNTSAPARSATFAPIMTGPRIARALHIVPERLWSPFLRRSFFQDTRRGERRRRRRSLRYLERAQPAHIMPG